MTNELLQLLPNHERANGNKKFYEKEIAHLKQLRKMKGDDGTDEIPVSDLVGSLYGNPKVKHDINFLCHCSPWLRAIQALLI